MKYNYLCLFVSLMFVSVSSYANNLSWQTMRLATKDNHISQTFYASSERIVQTDDKHIFLLSGKDLSGSFVTLPAPNGDDVDFMLTKASVMSPILAAKFPSIRSYIGLASDGSRARLTVSEKSISAMFQHQGHWANVGLYEQGALQTYVSYYQKDATDIANTKRTEAELFIPKKESNARSLNTSNSYDSAKITASGDTLITYRLAVAASGEYSTFFGGTTSSALAAIVDMVNRINEVMLVDLAIQFELVDDNDQLIYLDASNDPYLNDSSADDLASNQSIIDATIGSSNYDMGHLLNTTDSGGAFIGGVCDSSIKAQGYSGSTQPTGNDFYIGSVAHVFGHQLGATHTINASSSSCSIGRTGSSAWEPGSGSTIMSNAGLCDTQDLQDNSDPYFHGGSIEQIRDYIDALPDCGTQTTLNNSAPVISLPSTSYFIPTNTPFTLTAAVSDTDADALYSIWEELDAGGELGVTTTESELNLDNGYNPLFRSNESSLAGNTRYFPALNDVLNGVTSNAEVYPSTERDLTMRITVRDTHGGVNAADVTLSTVISGDGFSLNTPQSGGTWSNNETVNLSWDTANTELSPISCDTVSFYLDSDGAHTFGTLVLSGAVNDGAADITVPSISTSRARLMMKCDNNIFYAVNPGIFSIEINSTENVPPLVNGQAQTLTTSEDTSLTITLAALDVDDSDSDYPQGFTLTLEEGSNYSLDGTTLIPDANFNGNLAVGAYVNDGTDDSNVFSLTVTVSAVNDAPIAQNDSLSVDHNSQGNTLSVVNNDSDVDIDSDLTITLIEYDGTGALSIASDGKSLIYTPATGFSGSETFSYTISDSDGEIASANVTLTVRATQNDGVDTNSGSSSGGSLGWSIIMLCLLVFRRGFEKYYRLG